jgi:hypothetical protein
MWKLTALPHWHINVSGSDRRGHFSSTIGRGKTFTFNRHAFYGKKFIFLKLKNCLNFEGFFQLLAFFFITQTWAASEMQRGQATSSEEICINVKKQETTESCKTERIMSCSSPSSLGCQNIFGNMCPPPDFGYYQILENLNSFIFISPSTTLGCEKYAYALATLCRDPSTISTLEDCKVVEKKDCEPVTRLVPKVICGKSVTGQSPAVVRTTSEPPPKTISQTTQAYKIEDQSEFVQPTIHRSYQDPNNLQLNTFWSHFGGLIRNSNHLEKLDPSKHDKEHNYEEIDIKKFIEGSKISKKVQK